jgi:hypothetical protein
MQRSVGLMARGPSSWRAGSSAAAGIAVAFLLVVAGAGSAQAAKRKVGVSLNGPHASGVRDAIAATLKHHGFETASTDLAGDSAEAVSRAAKEGKLAAIIVGEVRDGGKRLKLRVYGSGGDLIGEGSWAEAGGIKKLEAVVERTLWARVGGSLSKAHAPSGEKAEKREKVEKPGAPEAEEAAPEAEAAEKTPTYSRSKEAEPAEAASSDEDEAPRKHKKKKKAAGAETSNDDEAPEAPTGSAATALELAVGPRFLWRKLSWSPQVMGLSPYSVGHAPSFGAFIAWYPAAHFRGGWASNIGIATSIEYTPGVQSQTGDGTNYPTTESDYWAGLRGRLAFSAAQASLTLAGGQQSFIFHSNLPAVMRKNLTQLPDVQYTYARAGIDLSVALPASFAVMLGGGYRYVLNAGDQGFLIQTSTYFPSSTFSGFDATAAVGYKFLSVLEARAGADLRLYHMTAGSNAYMVTSATDQYFALSAEVVLLLDGYAAGEGGPSAAPKAAAPATKGDDDE